MITKAWIDALYDDVKRNQPGRDPLVIGSETFFKLAGAARQMVDKIEPAVTDHFLPKTVDYLAEFTDALRVQLIDDDNRWGDTWLTRTREGQEDRIFETFAKYYKDFKENGKPINWLKVAGNALIAWVREEGNPDLFPVAEEKEKK